MTENRSTRKYDIIGDIHGCSKSLVGLLEKLGCKKIQGVYQHSERKIIYLGDFIDRGPGQQEVINIVRPMIEQSHALSVMGNHEFNAIAYASLHPDTGDFLRLHSTKNKNQHDTFLKAYKNDRKAYADVICWFKSLPLWLDLGELKIIHACWDNRLIAKLTSPVLSDELLVKSSTRNTWEYDAIETLLKGKEIKLPNNYSFFDKDKNERHHIRVRWWDQGATTYRSAFMGPKSVNTHIPDDEIEGDHLVEYGHQEPPVVLGHYWFEGSPEVLADNIACVDYSVAKTGGKLVAYRWDGEQVLSNDKFVWVDRVDRANP